MHLGLYVLAADTDDYPVDEVGYNEIFIALIPEDWQKGKGNFDDFEGKNGSRSNQDHPAFPGHHHALPQG